MTNLRILLLHTVCQHLKLEWRVRLIFLLLLVHKHLVPQHFIDQSSFDIHLDAMFIPETLVHTQGEADWHACTTARIFINIKQRRGQKKTELARERH